MIIHTKRQAEELIELLHEKISPNIKLIGSFGRRDLESKHDIDILIPDLEPTMELKIKLMDLLHPINIETTDWDGWYFSSTDKYGDVDIFFTDKDFDY